MFWFLRNAKLYQSVSQQAFQWLKDSIIQDALYPNSTGIKKFELFNTYLKNIQKQCHTDAFQTHDQPKDRDPNPLFPFQTWLSLKKINMKKRPLGCMDAIKMT